MNPRKRRWLKLLSLLLFISAGLYIEMTKLAPNRYKNRIEIIENEKIPQDFNNVSIAYFSDVLGDYKNLDKAITAIETMKPDMILFSGNLSKETLKEKDSEKLVAKLSALNAPLGKYTVIAELDTTLQNHPLLEESGFETLNSSGNLIHNQGSSAIELFGVNQAIETTNELSEHFTIALMNDPNLSINLNYDLLLAGKNLGGQIIIPLYGPVLNDSQLYKKRVDTKERTQIITQGLGTLKFDARLMTHPETVFIILKSGAAHES